MLKLIELLTNKIHTLATTGNSRNGLDCETSSAGLECLKKGDHMMVLQTGQNWATSTVDGNGKQVLNTFRHASNAIYPQMYTVKKISNEPIPQSEYVGTYGKTWASGSIPTFVRNQIVTDKSFNTNFHLSTVTALDDTSAAVFKFYPPTNKYAYAGECSNRGICDTDNGLCNCFNGFTNDNCDTIDALAQ